MTGRNKENPEDEAVDKLRDRGMRITSQRRKLIDFILSQDDHWTIQELAEKLKKRMPKLGIATIYRTVNLLVEEGSLSRTQVGTDAARYEITPEVHHDHLTCVSCDKILEFENEEIERLQEKISKKLGFKLVDHTMELYGECQRKNCPNLPKSK